MPDEIEHAGRKLVLNGQGVREATIFNISVYVGGLYLEKSSRDASAILASPETKRLLMRFLRDVDREAIVEAYRDGFEKNGGASVKDAVERFLGLMRGVKKGEEIALTYVADEGVTVEIGGEAKGVVPGAAFGRALFSIWLGASPPNKSLKQGLLGG